MYCVSIREVYQKAALFAVSEMDTCWTERRKRYIIHAIMTPPYRIEEGLSVRDLERYLRLTHGFLQKPMHVGISSEDEFVLATWQTGQALLGDANTHFCIAYDGDLMIGYACFNIHPALHVNGFECMVRELYVRPEYRRQGVGSSLLAAVEGAARAHSCKRVSLATNWQNDDQRLFYEAVNYARRCDFAVKSLA